MALNWLRQLFSKKQAPTDDGWKRKVVPLPERSDGSTNYLTGADLRNDSLLDGLVGTSASSFGNHGGWQNDYLGYGTARDKTQRGHFSEALRLTDPEITALHNGNWVAKRIIDAPVNEMFRRGWVLSFPGQAPAMVAGQDPGTKGFKPGDPAKKPSDPNAKPAFPAKPPRPDAKRTDASDPASEPGPAPPSGIAVPAGPSAPKTADKPLDPEGDQNGGADLAAQTEEYADRLALKTIFKTATIFGRAYGGGLIIVGANDGQDTALPLDEANIKTIECFTFIDRRFIVAHSYYDQIGPKYGEVEVYNIINPFGTAMASSYVHESRCIRFDGAPVDLLMKRRLAGWSLSMLQAPYDTMRRYETSMQSIAQLMSDMSQATMKINGLTQLISNDPKTLATRMRMVDMTRSSGSLVYLDAENEEFKREATPLNGVSDVLQVQMLELAGGVPMPVALLFGREPSGLNATGDADFRRFYDMIGGDQKQIVEPQIKRAYTLICLAKDSPAKGKVPTGGMQFVWHKLYEPSELEQANIRFLMAQADDLYINNQTLLPEEVAMSRFRSGDLNLDTEIQGDLRREKLATAELAPSGAEKAKMDQQNKQDEMKIKASAVAAKPGAPGAGPPAKT
jgi:uncharacterized protein